MYACLYIYIYYWTNNNKYLPGGRRAVERAALPASVEKA